MDNFDPARLERAEHRRNVWDFIIPRGCEPQALLEPGRWIKMAQKLRQWDRVELRSDDSTFFGEALVTQVGPEGVQLAMLYGTGVGQVGSAGAAQRAMDGERIVYRGPFDKWCVVRGEKVLWNKMETEAEAARKLGEHLATVAKGAA